MTTRRSRVVGQLKCIACEIEDNEDYPAFEEEVGMAWVQGFVRGLFAGYPDVLRADDGPDGPLVRAGLCDAHATYFKVVRERETDE